MNPIRVAKKGILDSRSVVPYSPALLEEFQCHLNVEICIFIKAVKYLYKYTYKGPDRACITKEVDEVSDFMDSRYVGGPEAAWRLLGFPLHGRSHAVERLPVHLPSRQAILFKAGCEAEAVANAKGRRTKLEAWIALNASVSKQKKPTIDLIRKCRYPDVPMYFRWDAKTCSWLPRKHSPKGGSVVGRMTHVKPTAGELYYLRTILLHVTGSEATSWESLQSVDGVGGAPSFQGKARELGCLQDDQETANLLREAVRTITSLPKLADFCCRDIGAID